MAKRITGYVLNGNLKLGLDSFIDINDLEVDAYSPKQARLKAAFKVKEQLNNNITVRAIYNAMRRVSIRER